MKHNTDNKRFSRNSGHLRCMMANMTCDLLTHERIKTTTPKAKELRRYTEKMITLGKAGTVSARRRAMAFLRSKAVVTKLFDDLAERTATRPGGYTRILKVGRRAGDCAPMSLIELVDLPPVVVEEVAKAKKAREKPSVAAKIKNKVKEGIDKVKEVEAESKKTPAKKEAAAKAKKAVKASTKKKDS